MIRVFFIGFLVLTISCKQTDQVRKPDTSWQSTDQSPVFPGCEVKETIPEQWICFQDSVLQRVEAFFAENPIENVNDTLASILLYLRVDHHGTILLESIEAAPSSSVRDAMQSVIDKLPKVSPATKTNLGVITQVQFRVPIQLKVQKP